MQLELKKVVVIGPESTGKSTLAETLASHYGVPWAKEYAREYIENLNREYTYEDLLEIAKGQIEGEELAAKEANELLICDTDLHVIQIWSEHKYRKTDPWILAQIQQRKYDLYLLLDIDIPWEEDSQREYPDLGMRQFFYDWFERLLLGSGVSVVKVSGDSAQRKAMSIEAIDRLLS
ncbi:AAA family ATPase [Echinicola sp. 20G]|uniref:AAA family ATPase n=1 Tax=Echinicola sp. 20G TaxID=2781961 RepID=UPI0019104AEC|nr:ATP-binding protein [Echinicola sp. 20G]